MAIEKLSVDIGADTSGLQSGFKLINSTLTAIHSAITSMNASVVAMSSAMQNGFSSLVRSSGAAQTSVIGTTNAIESLSESALEANAAMNGLTAPNMKSVVNVDRSQLDGISAPMVNPISVPVNTPKVNPISVPVNEPKVNPVSVQTDFSGVISGSQQATTAISSISSAASAAQSPVSALGQGFTGMGASALSTSESVSSVNFGEVASGANLAGKSVDGAASAFKGAKQPIVSVGDSVEETGEKMQNAERSCSSLTTGIKRLATIVATSAFLKGSISNAMEAESSVQQLDFTLGESSEEFKKWAESNANSLNMSKNQVMSYGKVYSNLISSMTDDTEQMSSATQQLLTASAVIASRTGRTTQDVMERIRSGLLGNTEAIEDLGVYANVSMIESTNAFKKIAGDKSWGQLSYKTQQQIRLMSILEQTQDKYGSEVLKNTASGVSNLSAVWENFKTNIGTALIPIVASILPALSAGITAITPVFVWLASAVSYVVGWFSQLSTPAKVFLGLSLGLAFAIPLVSKAMLIWAAVQKGLIAIQAVLIPQTWTFGAALKFTFGWLSIVVGALGLLWALFGNKKSNTVDTIDTTAISAENAAQSIANLTDSFKGLNAVTDETEKSKDKLAGFDEINVLSSGSGSLISELVKDSDLPLIDQASDGVANLKKQLNAIQGEYPVNLKTNEEFISTSLKTWFNDKWCPFWREVGGDMYSIFKGSAEESALAVEDLDGKCRKVFGDRWTDFWEKRGAKLCEGINNGQEGATGVLTSLDSFVRFTFGDRWSNYWQAVGGNMYDAFVAQENPVIGVFEAINEGIRGIFGNGWVEFWEDIGEKIYDALHPSVKEMQDLHFGFQEDEKKQEASKDNILNGTAFDVIRQKQIKPYATGGLPETGEMFVARESGPELVGRIGNSSAVANNGQIIEGIKQAVLSAMLQANASGSGKDITIHNYTELDGRVIGESVSKYSHGKAVRA